MAFDAGALSLPGGATVPAYSLICGVFVPEPDAPHLAVVECLSDNFVGRNAASVGPTLFGSGPVDANGLFDEYELSYMVRLDVNMPTTTDVRGKKSTAGGTVVFIPATLEEPRLVPLPTLECSDFFFAHFATSIARLGNAYL